jgi:hypothetical protein
MLRPVTAATRAELLAVFRSAQAEYRSDPAAAARFLAETQSATEGWPSDSPPEAELAALTVVANVILNLDAFLTKE